MKKKGFTLVELLAVIAILAILVIIALPNIMSLFNQAKQNSFETELKNIFKTAEQEWMKDSMFDTQNIVYARCKSADCTKELSLSGREEIEYYIEVDKAGNVIKLFATDGSYQYEYNGTGLKIEEIGNSKQVAKLESADILTVTCDGATKGGEDIGPGETPSESGLYRIMAEQAVLDNISSDYVTSSSGINFGEISSDTNGKGVYEIASTKADAYPIYYYRGNVNNNNVKFGGFCWKAVRTTNTGGVKLVYNGRPDASGHCTNTTGASTQIKTSKFNDDGSPAYVGYMYGTTDGTSTGTPYIYSSKKLSVSNAGYKFGESVTYSGGLYTLTDTIDLTDSNYNKQTDFNNNHYTCFSTSTSCSTIYYVFKIQSTTHYYISISGVNPNGRELIDVVLDSMFRNDRDSIAKTQIENWYRDNMTSYTSKLEDTVYCNDRNVSDLGGWSPTGNMLNQLYFSGYSKLSTTHKPSLICEKANDRFTVSPSLGNGKLKYPVGLLTLDEIMYAGGSEHLNKTYYLYTNQYYLSISPSWFYFFMDNAHEITAQANGSIYYGGVANDYGLRPVVSLSKNTSVTSGDGTANNPYVIE